MVIYIIAFLAPLFFSLSILIESFLSLGIFKKPTTMCFYVSITNALFVPLMFYFGMPTWPNINCWIIYTLLAIIEIAYLYPYYIALKTIDTSVVSSLFTLGKIWVPLLSFYFLGDIVRPIQYIGFIIIISTSLILNFRKTVALKINQAFYWMLLSGFLLACRVILAKYALETDTIWINTIIYPNIISGIIVFLFLVKKSFRPDIRHHLQTYMKKLPLFVLNEFVYFWGILCSIYALSKLSPVINTAIEATAPLILLLLSVVLTPFCPFKFKELHVSYLKKVVCFILMIVGIIFIT